MGGHGREGDGFAPALGSWELGGGSWELGYMGAGELGLMGWGNFHKCLLSYIISSAKPHFLVYRGVGDIGV